MPHQVIVTSAKTGPDRVVASTTIPNVTKIEFDLNDKLLSVFTENQAGNQIKEFDLTAIGTVTFAITAGNYTVTIA
jgi:hypothetical protein